METASESASRGKLVADLKVVLSDAESLLKAAATSTGERALELREKAAASLKNATEKLGDLQEVVVVKSKAAARATDDYVHENPWKAVGIAVGLGFLLGLLVNRK